MDRKMTRREITSFSLEQYPRNSIPYIDYSILSKYCHLVVFGYNHLPLVGWSSLGFMLLNGIWCVSLVQWRGIDFLLLFTFL